MEMRGADVRGLPLPACFKRSALEDDWRLAIESCIGGNEVVAQLPGNPEKCEA